VRAGAHRGNRVIEDLGPVTEAFVQGAERSFVGLALRGAGTAAGLGIAVVVFETQHCEFVGDLFKAEATRGRPRHAGSFGMEGVDQPAEAGPKSVAVHSQRGKPELDRHGVDVMAGRSDLRL